MRQERTVQASIFDVFAGHEIGRELKAMSEWLDAHRALLGLVAEDLRRDGVRATGRQGLPAEAVLRCALLKQYRQLSYEELAFHLEDSASFRAFARLPWGWSPKKSVLQKTISAIRAETWEAINRTLLASAQAGEARGRSRRAAGQHRHRGADARAERQQPALGRGAGDGRPVAGSGSASWRHRARLAQSLPGGQEAMASDRVHPRPAAAGPALPRAAPAADARHRLEVAGRGPWRPAQAAAAAARRARGRLPAAAVAVARNRSGRLPAADAGHPADPRVERAHHEVEVAERLSLARTALALALGASPARSPAPAGTARASSACASGGRAAMRAGRHSAARSTPASAPRRGWSRTSTRSHAQREACAAYVAQPAQRGLAAAADALRRRRLLRRHDGAAGAAAAARRHRPPARSMSSSSTRSTG